MHPIAATIGVATRSASHPENLDLAATYIERAFRDAHGDTHVQTFDARGRRYSNVIARFGPRDASLPLLVIGAHYDAFGDTGDLPGADDNASGTAGLLELARLLGQHEVASPVMLVAFTTEEPPFFGSEQMGSAVHANQLAADRIAVRGMICLEMIGFGIAGGWEDRTLARFVKQAMAGAATLPVVSFSGPRETSDASDQRNYWSHGWSAVVVTDTAYLRNPNYHTRRDTADTLDYERMAHVVDGVLNASLQPAR